jgi:polyphosphate kinase 2 (PPK2 family)
MFNKTHTIKSPWNIIKANKKTDARIEAINIILDKIPYNKKIDLKSEKIDF